MAAVAEAAVRYVPPTAQNPVGAQPIALAWAFWLGPVAAPAGNLIWLTVVQRVPDLVMVSAARPPAFGT
jgi:hypothetical protein